MPSALVVVARVHHVAETAFELEPDNVRVQERAAGGVCCFTGGENRGDERAARVRERNKAHVVIVERVRGNAVGEGRSIRPCRLACPQNLAVAAAFRSGHLLNHPGGRLDRARQDDADGVAYRCSGALPSRRGRDATNNEFSDRGYTAFRFYAHGSDLIDTHHHTVSWQ